MNRRDFIGTSCKLCLLSTALLPAITMAACSGKLFKTKAVNGQILIPLSSIPEKDWLIVRVSGRGYNLALRRLSAADFMVFEMLCTHAENPLQADGKGFVCNLHGSRFDESGAVIKGPAAQALTRLKSIVDSDYLRVQLNKE